MDIVGNLISKETETETAIVLSYKTENYYAVKSGGVLNKAKSLIGTISIGNRVIILKTSSDRYIVGADKRAARKRKEVVVNG